jgi:hypothetical protein
MSVAPTWYELPSWRVPRRLAPKIRGAAGSNTDQIWRLGAAVFKDAAVGSGLCLRVDSPSHGNVEPSSACSLAEFEANLGTTRLDWVVDEP